MPSHSRVVRTPLWDEPTREQVDEMLDRIGRNLDREFARMERLEAAGVVDVADERDKRRRQSDEAD